MSLPSRLPTSSLRSPRSAASSRGPRTSPPPSTSHTAYRTPSSVGTAGQLAAHSSHVAVTPLTAQQQQHLSDKVRVNGYLSDRWLHADSGMECLLADKQLTVDSLAELKQQIEAQLDDWPHTSHYPIPHQSSHARA